MKIHLKGWFDDMTLEAVETLGGDLLIPSDRLVGFLREVGETYDCFEVEVDTSDG